MKYDAVIIGSGLGGLECAHILSKAGMSVLLLERGTQAGDNHSHQPFRFPYLYGKSIILWKEYSTLQ